MLLFLKRYNAVVHSSGPQSTINESFFELRQVFANNWVDLWGMSTNPFLTALLPVVEAVGVELADISFNANPANLGEIAMNILIRKRRAALRLNLGSVTFLADDPNWEEAPQLIELFEELSAKIRSVAGQSPKSQECSLTFHVGPGTSDFGNTTRKWIREDVVGAGEFYGVTRHQSDSAITLDKSLKYSDGMYVRLQRTFPGDVLFPRIAVALFEDELAALSLLGIDQIP